MSVVTEARGGSNTDMPMLIPSGIDFLSVE